MGSRALTCHIIWIVCRRPHTVVVVVVVIVDVVVVVVVVVVVIIDVELSCCS